MTAEQFLPLGSSSGEVCALALGPALNIAKLLIALALGLALNIAKLLISHLP